jgi:hypothetical protein
MVLLNHPESHLFLIVCNITNSLKLNFKSTLFREIRHDVQSVIEKGLCPGVVNVVYETMFSKQLLKQLQLAA